MADLLTAALGGSLVAALTAAARAAGIPGDVKAHDAAIYERDDQFATWVADRDYELGRECEAIRAHVRAGGSPDAAAHAWPSGRTMELMAQGAHVCDAREADRLIADARGLALHQYRDQERLARLDVARTLAAEGWSHRVYRKLPARRPVPLLTTPERTVPILDAWRKQSNMSADHRPIWPDDATKRTLESALANVRALGP
ncbi:MAG: hypothetical protein WKF96_02890 [Solirubrobacteraceae bacterium]